MAAAALAAFSEHLSLMAIEIFLSAISIGLGMLLPVSTVAIQNAVRPHELGTATGVANFFRSIGGAFIVAIFGSIILGLSGVGGASGFEALGPAATQHGGDLVQAFHYVFAAAFLGFALSLLFLARMKELPLRGSAVRAAEAAIAD